MKCFLEQSDEALCALAAYGDYAAEECLVARYSQTVRACARPYFLAGGDSEDLIQEGMIGLLSAIRTFDPARDVRFRSYAETCIQNRLRSVVRAAASGKHEPLNQAVSLEQPYSVQQEDMAHDRRLEMTTEETPEDMLICREEHSLWIDTIIDGLSAFEGNVLRLYLGGLSYLQIASLLGKQTKAVDNAVQRIRRKAVAHFSSGDNSES